MRAQKILKTCAMIFLIVFVVILAIDVFKTLKINFDFLGMQQSKRISSSSNNDSVRYEPSEYIINNKEDVIEEVEKMVVELRANKTAAETEGLFEIANIHKLETFFYEYEQYAIVKYKLLNIIDELPILYKNTKGYTDTQLESYFSEKSTYIEKYYGITSSEDFINLVKSLSFLGNGKIKLAIVETITIDFDLDNDTLRFNIKLKADNNESSTYAVKAQYFKTSDNQVTPYMSFIFNG